MGHMLKKRGKACLVPDSTSETFTLNFPVCSNDIFGDVEIKKLVRPMRWQDYATTPQFPDDYKEVELEIYRQEFLLNRLHTQVQVRIKHT